MAADSGYIRIYDETNSLIYKRTAYSGGYASTVKLEGNTISFSVDLANTIVYVSSYNEPEINTKNIVVESSPEGEYTSTIITLPVAPNKVKLATGTEQIDEYSGYIELLQGQTKTTAVGAGFDTGGGAVIYYEGVGTTSKSYDLSTSSKWSALSDGEHTVQIVAKGSGYRDSAKSKSVTVTKGGSTGETWLLNSTLNGTFAEQSINFTSDNTNFVAMVASGNNPMAYSLKYKTSDSLYTEVFQPQLGWVAGEAYRTITFETAPTGDLLTWLQTNGKKQGV